MKSFYLRELLLLSHSERSARRVVFDRDVTLITGDNETGKSSLIKSIVRAFGAEPTRVNKKWKDADVRILLKFTVSDVDWAILRYGELFALYDANGTLTGVFRSVTNELAPRLSELFEFGLRLPDRLGTFTALPPAYYWLPFYMDQDASWTNSWAAFKNLAQFSNWKKAVIQYHAGIRGNSYYEAQAARMKADADATRVMRKRESLLDIYKSLNKRYHEGLFNVDFSAYQFEIESLLNECQTLSRAEEKFKQTLVEQRNRRQALATQLEITEQVQKESRHDYQLANDQAGHLIECPTCGAGYENSFAERFSIALDEDRCNELALQLAQEIRRADEEITTTLKAAAGVQAELVDLQALLAKKEGEVELSDLIRQQGRSELRELMTDDIRALEVEEDAFALTAARWGKAMQDDGTSERRAEVNRLYADHISKFLFDLDAGQAEGPALHTVDGQFSSTGSELPRALLAYQIAFLIVMREYSSAAFGPIIIDSPNQQDQDPKHHLAILRFIRDSRPRGAQLVLGVVNPAGVQFGGRTETLDTRYRLLSQSAYGSVRDEVQPYIEAAMSA